MGVAVNEANTCPLCGTVAKVLDIPTLMARCDCLFCGQFTFSIDLFRRVRELHPDHWVRTKTDIAKALHQGVVKKRHLETEIDIQNAIGDLSRTQKS